MSRSRGATLNAATSRRVSFAGQNQVRVAPGQEVASDPVPLAVRAGNDVAISIYAPRPTGRVMVTQSLNHNNREVVDSWKCLDNSNFRDTAS